MLLTPDLIKLRLKKFGIRADKFLGQHFLIDSSVLTQIKEMSESFVKENDTILEIGPGLGVLTGELITFPNQVIAVERDPVFAKVLPDFLGNPSNLTLVHGDVLDELHTNTLLTGIKNWCVIANIPYGITSPLLTKLAYRENRPHDILVLVQKEVAERVCAKPGDSNRGLLTLKLEVFYEPTIISTVSKASFWPEPKVESAVLRLALRDTPLIEDSYIKPFIQLVTAGFAAKRKQLGNSLSGSLGIAPQEAKQLLEKAEIDSSRRAETLSVEEWKKLARQLEGRS